MMASFSGAYFTVPILCFQRQLLFNVWHTLNLGESASGGTGIVIFTSFATDRSLNWDFTLIRYSILEWACDSTIASTQKRGLMFVVNRYDKSSNSPSGGTKLMTRSLSNRDRETHLWNFTSSISIVFMPRGWWLRPPTSENWSLSLRPRRSSGMPLKRELTWMEPSISERKMVPLAPTNKLTFSITSRKTSLRRYLIPSGRHGCLLVTASGTCTLALWSLCPSCVMYLWNLTWSQNLLTALTPWLRLFEGIQNQPPRPIIRRWWRSCPWYSPPLASQSTLPKPTVWMQFTVVCKPWWNCTKTEAPVLRHNFSCLQPTLREWISARMWVHTVDVLMHDVDVINAVVLKNWLHVHLIFLKDVVDEAVHTAGSDITSVIPRDDYFTLAVEDVECTYHLCHPFSECFFFQINMHCPGLVAALGVSVVGCSVFTVH